MKNIVSPLTTLEFKDLVLCFAYFREALFLAFSGIFIFYPFYWPCVWLTFYILQILEKHYFSSNTFLNFIRSLPYSSILVLVVIIDFL